MKSTIHEGALMRKQLRAAQDRIAALEADLARMSLALCMEEDHPHGLFHEIRDAFALHEVLCGEDGRPGGYRLVAVNPAFERLTGKSAGDIKDRSIDDVFPDIDPHCLAAFTRVAQGGAPEYFESYSRDRNRWYEIKAYRPAERHVAVLLSDITDRKRAEEELRAAKADAEAANAAKTRFLANVSHEIRTPLNGVLGMLQLLRGDSLTPDQQRYVDIALTSGKGLLRVLEDILNITQAEAGALQFKTDPFDPCEVARAAGRIFELQAQDRDIAFDMHLDDSIDCVLGDDGRLRLVLVNVLGNAFKFTDRGRIDLCLTRLPSGREDQTRLLFTVSDTGIGMHPERVEEAFGAFTQLDGSTTRRHQGAGLGLGIVKRLVEQMNGTLAVDSTPGKGTTLYVSMPFALPRTLPAAETDAPRNAPHAMTFILAEDDPVNRLVATRLLERLGHAVLTAEDGREALELLAAHQADAVLLDVQMPVMDGLEAARRIRTANGGWNPSIPVIAMTAHALQTDRDNCMAAGMDAYIAKPVDMDDLTRTLEALLQAT